MPILFSTLFMIIAIIFGGTQVVAAQSSMPDQPLYSVKLASEDVRANLTATGQSRIDLEMDFADLRLQEAIQLASEGKPIPATVWERMDSHLDLGLNTAAGLNDEQLVQQLLRIQSRLQTELDKLAQLYTDSRYTGAVESVQAALKTRLQLVTIGLSDPAAFREYMQSDKHQPNGLLDATASPTATPLPTEPAPTSTATALPISSPTAQPTSTAITQPSATIQPKVLATQAPNPGTNPNGHPHGCCCPWCMSHYGNTSGGYGGNWGGNNGGHGGHGGGGRHH